MAQSKGKKFEAQFKSDWDTTVGNFCYRLYDVMSGYTGVATPCDFICYKYPLIYLIDCKSHDGNTISFNDFAQYERMLPYKDIKGVIAGTVAWMYKHDKVVWIPIQTWEKIKNEGGKSFNIKMLDNPDYECWEIPSKKKRVFMSTDYSQFVNHFEETYE